MSDRYMSDPKRLLLLDYYYRVLYTQQSNKVNSNAQFQILAPCNAKNAVWGSEKPVQETCPPQNLHPKGIPCMNIWNNSTKRKTIVNETY